MPNFNKLKEEVDKLQKLLEDQQPGLMSWCEMMAEAWKNISDMWIGKERKDETSV